MISLSRPFFTPVAILLRQSSGGFVVGFLPFVQTMLWFVGLTLFLLLLRGFAEGTWLGGLLDIPIAQPMAVLTGLIAAVWCLRITGIWTSHGPLRDHNAFVGFTGRAARFWSRLGWTEREWTVLEIYEPMVLSLSGAVLLLFPWTRIAGGMLLVMAAVCAYQTIQDQHWNSRGDGDGESFDDFIAGVLSSGREEAQVEYDDRPHVPGSPYADLPDDVVALMDDDAKAAVEQARNEASPPPRCSPAAKRKRPRFVELKPRGPAFHRPGPTLAAILYFALALGLFAVILSPSEVYEKAPDRWRSAILSVQTGAARLWLARPADREQVGGLATAVLNRVAPDDLGKLRRDAVRREEERVDAELAEASAAVYELRNLVEEKLGLTLDVSSTTPQLDELILEHDSVAEAWVALINGAGGYTASIADARERLDNVWVPGGVDVESYDALFEEVEPWDREVKALGAHVDHIASMLETKRFEDALDRNRESGP